MARPAAVPRELTRRPFSLIEARRAGLTLQQLRGANWRRVGPGLYVWAGLPQNPALVLAAMHRRLPSGAAFSGQTAAWLHGVDLPPCEPIEVVIPRSCGVSALAGAVVCRAPLAPDDTVERRGLPVTSAIRTVADLGRRPPLVDAVVAVDMALNKELVSLAELRAYVAKCAPAKGIVQLRKVVDLAEPASQSPGETRLRMLLVLAGLPRPRAQVSLHDQRRRFVGRPDLYYPVERLGLEYDGGGHRNSLVEDNRRQNLLLNAGYHLLRFSGADIRSAPDSVVAQVRQALGLPAPERSRSASRPR